jgi:hypothetical protein
MFLALIGLGLFILHHLIAFVLEGGTLMWLLHEGGLALVAVGCVRCCQGATAPFTRWAAVIAAVCVGLVVLAAEIHRLAFASPLGLFLLGMAAFMFYLLNSDGVIFSWVARRRGQTIPFIVGGLGLFLLLFAERGAGELGGNKIIWAIELGVAGLAALMTYVRLRIRGAV